MKIVIVDKKLKDYDSEKPIYQAFTLKICELIKELLNAKSIKVSSVTCRLKEKESLKGKIKKHDNKYKSLTDITDISGVRIITLFEDDVDKVARVIRDEFSIDQENSVDKRKLIDPDRFGYLSLHYVVSLSPERASLTENEKYSGLKCEIQVRSILQHAWAEIEHDLGYKSKEAIPRDIRRSFSRLAGLLEIADSEFESIRNALEQHERTVDIDIKREKLDLLIDKASLSSYIRNSELVNRLDREIVGESIKLHSISEDLVDSELKRCSYFGIDTIKQLDILLQKNEKLIINFAEKWLSIPDPFDDDDGIVHYGISLFYLDYILIAKSNNIDRINEYLDVTKIGMDEQRSETARDILKVYQEVKSS